MPELKLTKDSICITETLLDTAAEQPVELDYSLPDYYPGIFRLLKTSVRPMIQQTRVSGNRLTVDGLCKVNILYIGEDGEKLQNVEQMLPFSRTLELKGESDAPVVRCSCRCYHASGRAVSPRRLDVRGGVSIRVKVTAQKEIPVITAASGNGIQLHTRTAEVCGRRRSAMKPFSVSEELEIPQSKPPFGSLVSSRTAVRSEEIKIIANKVICRGEMVCHILYLPEGGGCPETMEYTIPISQIADLPGVDEDDLVDVRFEPAGLLLEPLPGENGSRRLDAEWTMLLDCVSDRVRETAAADDAYSICCPVEIVRRELTAERPAGKLDRQYQLRAELNTEPLSSVSDVICNVGEVSARPENGAVVVSGTLELCAVCFGKEGTPFAAEKTMPFEMATDLRADGDISCMPSVRVLSVSHSIPSETTAEVRIQLQLGGTVCEKLPLNVITDLHPDEDTALPPPSCALRLYFGEPGEAVWDIARRFGASVTAVMEENDLDSETLQEKQMLLIPLRKD